MPNWIEVLKEVSTLSAQGSQALDIVNRLF